MAKKAKPQEPGWVNKEILKEGLQHTGVVTLIADDNRERTRLDICAMTVYGKKPIIEKSELHYTKLAKGVIIFEARNMMALIKQGLDCNDSINAQVDLAIHLN